MLHCAALHLPRTRQSDSLFGPLAVASALVEPRASTGPFRIRTHPRAQPNPTQRNATHRRSRSLACVRARAQRSSPGNLCAMTMTDGGSVCRPARPAPFNSTRVPRCTVKYSTAEYIHTRSRTAARRSTSRRIIAPLHRRTAPSRRVDVSTSSHVTRLIFLTSLLPFLTSVFLSSLLSFFLSYFLPSAAAPFPHPGFSPPSQMRPRGAPDASH